MPSFLFSKKIGNSNIAVRFLELLQSRGPAVFPRVSKPNERASRLRNSTLTHSTPSQFFITYYSFAYLCRLIPSVHAYLYVFLSKSQGIIACVYAYDLE